MSGPLLVYGASGHGKVVAETARAAGFSPIVFADDSDGKRGTRLCGAEVAAIGRDEALRWLATHDGRVVVAIGHNQVRARVLAELMEAGARPATVVHPSAVIAPTAVIGSGTVVFAGVVVQPDAEVGANVILNTACSVDHDGRIGDHAHLSPGVHLGGTVTVGAGTHLGVGCSVIQGITVGHDSTVGAGSVVVRDLPDGIVAYGVPARVRRQA
ncbi:MAG: acetyltransferase [Myxococcales bacterium]|nr:acetyltransferase [Myxococcales bacterium]